MLFTPNNDQLNDKFGVNLDCSFSDFHINIYTRWGDKIFESHDITKYWDGKLNNIELPSDVYFYSVSFVNEKGNPQHYSSQVSLIR
jgi:gliding motility-associated-like protein